VARVDSDELGRWRGLEAVAVLSSLVSHAKRDPSFNPTKALATERWHATAGGRKFELLLTGPKFYDTRAGKGGGGAVDLAMHLFRLDFKGATELLRRARL
jgi:hypothetical protein